MSEDRLTIDDLVVLGNAVPDEISDSRKTVCVAGYSQEHGLIRIYPVPPNAPMKRWNIVEVSLERNPKDTRTESWKVQGSKAEWDKLASKIRLHGKLGRDQWVALLKNLHSRFGVGCVQELNELQLSLGLVIPKTFEPRFEKRDKHDPTAQLGLFQREPFLTIHNYDVQPRITYRCSDCKVSNPHDQQVLEWGIYEWIRQNPDKKEEVWKNLHIGEPNYETSFLVGNQAFHRNSFLIISIFRYKQAEKKLWTLNNITN